MGSQEIVKRVTEALEGKGLNFYEFCVCYKVASLEKPGDFMMPLLGWLRAKAVDSSVLDNAIGFGRPGGPINPMVVVMIKPENTLYQRLMDVGVDVGDGFLAKDTIMDSGDEMMLRLGQWLLKLGVFLIP